MAIIPFNAFNQVTAQGKLELTPNANIFTCQISPEYTGDDLVPAQAVKLKGSNTGVPVVVPVEEGDDVFGFVALDHKYNNYAAGKLCRIASDYAVMSMVSDGAITRGDNVTVSGTATVATTEDKATSVGVALDNSFDGAILRVLIKCIGNNLAETPAAPEAGTLMGTGTFTATFNSESAVEEITAGMAVELQSSEDGIVVDAASTAVHGFLLAQAEYTKGGSVTVATSGSIVYLTAGETITAGDGVVYNSGKMDVVGEGDTAQGIALQSASADDLFACKLV